MISRRSRNASRTQQLRFQQDLMSREQTFKEAHPDFDTVVRGGLAGKVAPGAPASPHAGARWPGRGVYAGAAAGPGAAPQHLTAAAGAGGTRPALSAAAARHRNGTTTNGATAPTPALPAPMTPLSGSGAGHRRAQLQGGYVARTNIAPGASARRHCRHGRNVNRRHRCSLRSTCRRMLSPHAVRHETSIYLWRDPHAQHLAQHFDDYPRAP